MSLSEKLHFSGGLGDFFSRLVDPIELIFFHQLFALLAEVLIFHSIGLRHLKFLPL